VPYLSRSDFTAANGSNWPLNPGSWLHERISGTVNFNARVNNNAGRVNATNTATGDILHRANTAVTATHLEARVRAARVGGADTVIPYVVVRYLDVNNYIRVTPNVPAKMASSGVRLDIVGAGVVRFSGAVSALHTTGFVWIGVQVRQIDGLVIISAKCWLTTEPPWIEPTSFNNGDGGTDTGSDWARLWHVWQQAPQAGQMGLLTGILSSNATGAKADYDDWLARTLTPVSRVTLAMSTLGLAAKKLRALAPAQPLVESESLRLGKSYPMFPATATSFALGNYPHTKAKTLPPVEIGGARRGGFDPFLFATRGVIRLRRGVAI
jgi:hypothetical protein